MTVGMTVGMAVSVPIGNSVRVSVHDENARYARGVPKKWESRDEEV